MIALDVFIRPNIFIVIELKGTLIIAATGLDNCLAKSAVSAAKLVAAKREQKPKHTLFFIFYLGSICLYFYLLYELMFRFRKAGSVLLLMKS